MRLLIIPAAVIFVALNITCTTAQNLPLRQVLDVQLTGRASRFDYQSFDAATDRLYIAHMGDNMMTVFDTRTQKVVGDVKDLKNVHGVLAVPELRLVYATATGTNELAVIDDQTLEILARVPAGDYPDVIAYASREKKIYVSDKQGKTNTVIDARTNKVIATIRLNAPAGNTQYDAVSNRIFVAVHKLDQIIEIDPQTDKIVGGYKLPGCEDSHGLLIDAENRLAFAACEGNAKLAVFDLANKKMLSIHPVGDEPDVLAFDSNLRRLYVSAESGVLTVFDEKEGGQLEMVGKGFYTANAHTVAVDSATHRVYLPLENVNGKPVLRIALPSDKQIQ
jgi:YVTN family beta-propeller protein